MASPLTDEQIAKMAKARVGFKVHAMTYVVVNLFLMAIWALAGGMGDMHNNSGSGWSWNYWPMWTHLGWGVGLAMHGLTVYGPGSGMQEREEQKIRQQIGRT